MEETYIVLYVYYDTTEVRYAGSNIEEANKVYQALPKRSKQFQTWVNGSLKAMVY